MNKQIDSCTRSLVRYRLLFLALAAAMLGPLTLVPVTAAAASPSPRAPQATKPTASAPPHKPSEPLASGPAANSPDEVSRNASAAPTVDLAAAAPVAKPAAPAQDWPMFLHDLAHTAASGEAILSPGNANLLQPKWKPYVTGGVVAASPTVVGGVVYVGSWDGFEYAIDATTGALKWKTFLGQTTNPACHPATIGITSAAAVENGVVYVGGGDRFWYALDAGSGAVLWKVDTGDNSQAGGHYNWSSPVVYNGSAYVGIASNCDNPLVQGQLLKVDLAAKAITATAKFVPDGQVGGGIWTTPAIDVATKTVYVTTGTLNLVTQDKSEALVALDAATLAINDWWQLPRSQAGSDSDWGNSPTLFSDGTRALVTAINKNGLLYAFDRAKLKAGPVWSTEIAIGGDCPTCGDGSISSSAFANGVLYIAGGNTVIDGVGYRGAVRAINPKDGKFLWQHGTDQPVVPSIAWVNGTIVESEGATVEVLDAASGKSLYSYQTGGPIYSAPSVSNGSIYFGSSDSKVYGLAMGKAVTPPADPNCPAGFTCQDIRNPQKGSESTNGNVLTVTASGAAIHGTSDQFRFLYQKTAGDVQVTTQLLSQSTQNLQPQAGLMVRQSSAPDSPFYGLLEYPNNNTENQPDPKLLIWYRTGFGTNSIQANKVYPAKLPKKLMIQRSGNVFSASAYDETDKAWRLIPGSRQTIVMPDQVLTGIAQNSGATGNTGTATYSDTTVGQPNITPAAPKPATQCPDGWSCRDISDTSPVGDQSLTNGVWTLKGVGNDIGGFQDSFHYVWQTLPADGVLTARVAAQGNTSPNAKAGIMLRQNADPGSSYYGAFVTPGKGVTVQWRVNNNLITREKITQPGAAPLYLRIARYTEAGTTTYTAFTSPDGNNWNAVLGSTVEVNLTGQLLAGLAATANAPRVQSAVTFDKVSLTNTAPRPPTVCPVGWTCTDVGTATPPGAQSFNNGTWTFLAGGPDIWDVYDGYRFAYQQLAGDGSVSARVLSQAKSGPWQKSGVMLRATNGPTVDPSAPYYGVFVTASNGIVVQYRPQETAYTSQVKIAGGAPAFLKASRWTDPNTRSTYFSAYTSPNGVDWTLVPSSTVILDIPAPLQAGLAADSYNNTTSTTVFDQVNVSNASTPPTPCPQSWTCGDIGQPTPIGQQALKSVDSIEVQGGGGDIWNTSDQFHFVWQQTPGDVVISAKAGSQTATDPWAKAGLMLRAGPSPAAPYFAAFVTSANGVAVQWRTAQGGTTGQVKTTGAVPVYLRVTRAGTTFTAHTSTDGAAWTPVPGSTVAIPALSGTLLGGLAVTSHNATALSTVLYSSITIGAPPVTCPTGWSCADVGNATPAGTETVTGGTWNVKGGGGDIWNVSDQFRFESKGNTGDGMVSARVASQTNTNPWAKAGLMLRATSDPGSPYYGVFLTPSNGVAVQYRTAQGATTQAIHVAGTAPVYLGVARSGATFTAYSSPDGGKWTAIPGSSLALNNLPGTVLAGLAVTSHDTSVLSAVSFDTVTFAPNLPERAPVRPPSARPATAAAPGPGASPAPPSTRSPTASPKP